LAEGEKCKSNEIEEEHRDKRGKKETGFGLKRGCVQEVKA